jgi:large subunit ribosomal protein L21
MYAIIRHGNSQFRVAPGDRITVRGEGFTSGQAIEFADVLAVVREGQSRFGAACSGVKVTGEVIRAGRSRKIIVQHFRRREGFEKKQGHRQGEAVVRIKEIVA